VIVVGIASFGDPAIGPFLRAAGKSPSIPCELDNDELLIEMEAMPGLD
jgi:hypothetical protein